MALSVQHGSGACHSADQVVNHRCGDSLPLEVSSGQLHNSQLIAHVHTISKLKSTQHMLGRVTAAPVRTEIISV